METKWLLSLYFKTPVLNIWKRGQNEGSVKDLRPDYEKEVLQEGAQRV